MKINCDTCDKEYCIKPSRYARSEKHYCSKACMATGEDIACTGCGKLIHREPKQLALVNKPFCTRDCQASYYQRLGKVNCSVCDKELFRQKSLRESNETGVYLCSNECRSRNGNRYTEVTCCVCGVKFEKATADLERFANHCCSIACRSKNNDKRTEAPCIECNKLILRPPSLRDKRNVFCSEACHNKHQDHKVDCKCAKCGADFQISPVYFNRTLHNKNFCSTVCSSKFRFEESYVEKMFSEMLTEAGIKHERNDRTIIKPLELDVWIPDARFAVEINGPTHYKPIYGEASLKVQRARDKRKRESCKELGIRLRVVKPAANGVMQRRFAAVIREVKKANGTPYCQAMVRTPHYKL